MADLSVIIVSHDKPRFIREALKSVLDQTHQNWQAILVDSGVLLNQGHFKEYTDPRLQIIPSGETRALAQTKNMASWCFNNVIRSGILTGELILYLCDDDLFYPEAFSTYWNFYTANDRKPQAMYASQDIGAVEGDGPLKIIGQRRAKKPAGKFCRKVRQRQQSDAGAGARRHRLRARQFQRQFRHPPAVSLRFAISQFERFCPTFQRRVVRCRQILCAFLDACFERFIQLV